MKTPTSNRNPVTATVFNFPVRTHAEVSLRALVRNLSVLREASGAEMIPVVKADAYGHGMVPVTRALVRDGTARMVAVATLEEALELRKKFSSIELLVLSGFFPHQLDAYTRYKISPVIHTLSHLQALQGRRFLPQLHLKVDTGLRRLGIQEDEWAEAARVVAELPVKLSGFESHFAESESTASDFTDKQIASFERALAIFREKKLLYTDARLHIANSGGILRKKLGPTMAVRPGLAMYGISPNARLNTGQQLAPVLTWKTKVLALKHVKKGESVGYGRTYEAPNDMTLAVLPVGYGDGYCRAFSNKGEVLLGGRRVPVRGRVSMDLISVDCTGISSVKEGMEAVLLGKHGVETIGADELARWADTIPYEVLCGISHRVPRIYLDD